MNNYTFEVLSPLRFEQLVRDLLKTKYGGFENFSAGKDGGIDFRYSQSNDKILIVQCKRYKSSSTLFSNLKREAEKALTLKFTDYLLVVSLDLTDKNKKEILELYKGKIKGPAQIITNGDLNDLLGLPENHHVEFKFPELWMNSINVHQKIFHLGFLNHSGFIKDKIQESLKNFVPYKTYYNLLEHFNDHNIAIICGTPGIGKTTLSHAIISNFIFFRDYKLIDISYRPIQEVESHIYSDQPTIFLIDDFLGKIKLDKDNDYAQLLLYLIEKIDQLENKKLIVTSRENIWRKGLKELFPISSISDKIEKYVIELGSFTRRIRTEILYNHLKNSKLPSDFIDVFLKRDFKKIIDHANYNPRVIEHLTEIKLLKGIKAETYFDFFLENLDRPHKIWDMVYNNLPNDLYKLILLIRFLVKEQMPVADLGKAVTRVIEKSEKFQHYSYDDFEYIINEMEGTFFTFQTGYDEYIEKEYTVIEFQNPSIIDFIDGFIWQKEQWLQLIIENAIYFEQLFSQELLDIVEENESLLKVFRHKILTDFNTLDNAGFGYFDYESGDEGSFVCWIPERYNYYLMQLSDVMPAKNDPEVTEFLKKEIFRRQIDYSDDISEKIAFAAVAEELLSLGVIDDKKAIRHYISGSFLEIKELVFLEYMTRFCSKESLSIIKKDKELVDYADGLFTWELKDLKNKSYMEVSDFFDDYLQIKKILPLKNAAKMLKVFNFQELAENLQAHHQQLLASEDKLTEKKTDELYHDIDDQSIEDLIKRLEEKLSGYPGPSF